MSVWACPFFLELCIYLLLFLLFVMFICMKMLQSCPESVGCLFSFLWDAVQWWISYLKKQKNNNLSLKGVWSAWPQPVLDSSVGLPTITPNQSPPPSSQLECQFLFQFHMLSHKSRHPVSQDSPPPLPTTPLSPSPSSQVCFFKSRKV